MNYYKVSKTPKQAHCLATKDEYVSLRDLPPVKNNGTAIVEIDLLELETDEPPKVSVQRLGSYGVEQLVKWDKEQPQRTLFWRWPNGEMQPIIEPNKMIATKV